MSVQLYANRAQVESIWSTYGVSVRLDDMNTHSDGSGSDTDAIVDNVSIPAQNLATYTVVHGAAVDVTLGHVPATLCVGVSHLTGAYTLTCLLEESDNGITFTTISSFVFTAATADTLQLPYIGGKQYVRVSVTLSAGPPVAVFASVMTVTESNNTYMTDCLERATCDMNFYLFRAYSVAVIAGSAWASHCCASLAACYLGRRRGNPVPESLEAECRRYTEQLEMIFKGKAFLPADTGLALPKHDDRPSVSNMTIDLRFFRTKIRRVLVTSTGGYPPPETLNNPALDQFLIDP